MARRFWPAPLFRELTVRTIFGLGLILAAILMLAVLASVSPPLVVSPILADATV
jgi:hypothetical protein